MAQSRDDIFGAIKEHLADRGIESEKIVLEADLMGDLDLDSLDVAELTSGLEEQFSIEIPDDELEDLSTVGDAVGLIEKKLTVGA